MLHPRKCSSRLLVLERHQDCLPCPPFPPKTKMQWLISSSGIQDEQGIKRVWKSMQCDSGIGLAREYDKTSKVDKATIVTGWWWGERSLSRGSRIEGVETWSASWRSAFWLLEWSIVAWSSFGDRQGVHSSGVNWNAGVFDRLPLEMLWRRVVCMWGDTRCD